LPRFWQNRAKAFLKNKAKAIFWLCFVNGFEVLNRGCCPKAVFKI